MAYLKPQAPLMNGEDYIYPITTTDQVVKADGSRLEQNGVITVDQAANANQLNGKDAKYYSHPRNLLDNSYWENLKEIVNQRGQTSYTGAYAYSIDRWIIGNSATMATVQITDNGLVLSADEYTDFSQNFENYDSMKGKTYTIGLKTSDGSIYACSFVMGGEYGGVCGPAEVYSTDGRNLILRFSESTTILWAALYEGTYTADNLPPYVPKGYAAELAECFSYAWITDENMIFRSGATNNGYAANIIYPTRMRIAPSVEFEAVDGTTLGDGTVLNGTRDGISVWNPNFFTLGKFKVFADL